MIRRVERLHEPLDVGVLRLVVVERAIEVDVRGVHARLRLPVAVRVADPAGERTLRV